MLQSRNIYFLPVFDDDLKGTVSDPHTHVGMDAQELDFIVPTGSPVRAAAAGKIIFIKTDSREGGDDPRYEDFTFYNHIVIKHAEEEYTEYGHLQFQGTNKKLGDTVIAGEIIGYSGNTGYSAQPHLHFSVFTLKKMPAHFETLPAGKDYFINDSDFGFMTVQPRFKK